MDRPLDDWEIRRQWMRRSLKTAAALTAVIAAVLVVRSCVQPSLRRDRVRIATVERGTVEAATLCSGTVVPATEQVIPSPFDSRVLRVYEQPGARLEPGQTLLQLDETDVRLRAARLGDEIALKENRRQELRLELDRRLAELAGRLEIQRERLAFLESKTAQQRALHELGLTAIYALRQAELDERIAAIELRQIQESMDQERQSTTARIAGLEIELAQARRNLADQRERLERATVRSEGVGVLTWIADQEGAVLREGAVVARVADLSRFRVEASASDLHANRFSVGMPVRVEVGENTLRGEVSSIPPAVEDGVMTLLVELEEPSSDLLRSNMRVDVHVITSSRTQALRVKKGPFVPGSGEHAIYVVEGDEAVRRTARIGVSGVDGYEILSGASEGDRVIVSSMEDYKHLERIRIR